MQELVMLIGLPGSGKSYLAKKFARQDGGQVFSSDETRRELFGDENVQDNPALVFEILHNRIYDYFKSGGERAFYDATNISSRRRKAFLNSLASRKINVIKTCYVAATSLETCIERDAARERTVGEKVILKMMFRFCIPSRSEGWDNLYCFPENTYKQEHSYLEKRVEELMDYDQENKNHTLSLGEHLRKTEENLPLAYKNLNLGLLHDIGKPYVKAYKENGEACYYNHDNVSAYLSLLSLEPPTGIYLDIETLLRRALAIHLHMRRFSFPTEGAFNRWLRTCEPDVAEMVIALNKADIEAH